MVAGCYLRLAPLSNWLDHKERYFFDNQQIPLMITVDSYFYLDIAKDLQEGKYSNFDPRRHVPEGHERPSTPPLLSVLLAWLSTVSGVSLEWLAILLPPFLGTLLAIPAYIMGFLLAMRARCSLIREEQRTASARLMGLVTAFCTLLSPFFAARSAIGWFDTDVLNVTFPLLLALYGLKLADGHSKKEHIFYLSNYLLISLLFLWWWDQSHVPVFGFAAIPFVTALIFIGLRSPRELILPLSFGFLLLFIIGLWKGFTVINPLNYLDSLGSMTHYIMEERGDSPFLPAGIAVSEQNFASLKSFIMQGFGWTPGLIFSALGLLSLTFLVRGYIFFLAAIIIVALMSFKGARFLIFTAPLFGLGVGTLVFLTFHGLKNRSVQMAALSVILLMSSWGAARSLGTLERKVPRRLPVLFDAMKNIEQKTPQDAIIWASWGHGHPLIYYGQRGTIADGIYHSAELQYFLYVPIATGNYRLAANWMSFYVVNGSKGLQKFNAMVGSGAGDWGSGMVIIQKLLAAGVSSSRKLLAENYNFSADEVAEIVKFLFPGNPRPVYLFLDYLLPTQAWFKIGRWDLQKRQGPGKKIYLPMKNVRIGQDKIITASSRSRKIIIDPSRGSVTVGKRTLPLQALNIHDGKKMNSKKYQRKKGLIAEIFLPARMGVLADEKTADTLLTRLFYEFTYNKTFFDLVDMSVPHYSLWQVHGEKYSAAKD